MSTHSHFQSEYEKALRAKLESLVKAQDEGRRLRDALSAVQQSFISHQHGVINKSRL